MLASFGCVRRRFGNVFEETRWVQIKNKYDKPIRNKQENEDSELLIRVSLPYLPL